MWSLRRIGRSIAYDPVIGPVKGEATLYLSAVRLPHGVTQNDSLGFHHPTVDPHIIDQSREESICLKVITHTNEQTAI